MQETAGETPVRQATLVGELAGEWFNRVDVRLPILAGLRECLKHHFTRAEELEAQAEGMQQEAGKSRIAMYRLQKLIAALEEFHKEDDDKGDNPLSPDFKRSQ